MRNKIADVAYRIQSRSGLAVLFQWRIGALLAYVIASFLFSSVAEEVSHPDRDVTARCSADAARDVSKGME